MLATLMACLAVLSVVVPAEAEDPDAREARGDTDEVVHRYVWDQFIPGRKGIHLRTAALDGADVTAVYDSRRGWTLDLTMDRTGHRVAFSPCCQVALPAMVVVDITTKAVWEPLANHPEIDAIGGIGWSPDGRRIAFEGFSGSYPHRHGRIWTVRPDGTGLRRVLHLFNAANANRFFSNEALAWTSDGILYSDGRDLRVARRAESHVVLPRVLSVRISGDGLHVVTTRFRRDGSRSVWMGDPDGTDQRRLFRNEPGDGAWYKNVTPSHDGQSLSALRDTSDFEGEHYNVVTWNVHDGPGSAAVIDVTDDNYVFTWN